MTRLAIRTTRYGRWCGSAMYGLIAGYEDQNDHDTLRHDPIFQLICDRVPDNAARAGTASQPTLTRFENSIGIPSLFRLRELLVDQFHDAFETPPTRLTFDLYGFDDPAHGQQQLTLFSRLIRPEPLLSAGHHQHRNGTVGLRLAAARDGPCVSGCR